METQPLMILWAPQNLWTWNIPFLAQDMSVTTPRKIKLCLDKKEED